MVPLRLNSNTAPRYSLGPSTTSHLPTSSRGILFHTTNSNNAQVPDPATISASSNINLPFRKPPPRSKCVGVASERCFFDLDLTPMDNLRDSVARCQSSVVRCGNHRMDHGQLTTDNWHPVADAPGLPWFISRGPAVSATDAGRCQH